KHALTQEATYQSILERKRREFHLQVAQGIERLYHERLEEFYEELAEHYSKSDDTGKAVKYLLKAGDKAKQNYYNDIAISRYQKALEIIEQKKIERNEWKLEALRGLGEVYPGVGKITESVKAFESAIELAKEMKLSTREIVRLYYWVADSLCWQSRYDRIIEYGETGLRLLEGDDKCEEAALMNSIIATGNGYKGNMVKFVDHVRKNMAFIMSLPYSVELSNSYIDIIAYLYGTVKDLKNAWEWSEEYKSLAKKHNDLDSLGVVLLLQGIILNIKGDYKGAISLIQKGLEIHQDIGYAHQQGRQHGKMSLNLYSLGNINEAKFHAKNHLNIAEQLGNPEDIAEASLQLGNIEICQNQWEDAISYYQKHIKACQDIGNIFAIFWANLGLANAYLRKGDFKKTIEIYSKAADDPITIYNQFVFATILAGLERAYTTLNTPEGFLDFCNSFKKRHADEIGIIPFTHWYFVPTEPSTDYTNLAYSDSFDSDKLESSWTWIDEFGDCNYRIDIGKGLEISAANGRGMFDIRQDAPRILREFSGDFALEVSVLPVSDEKPQIGGILVWKDKDNFLMFENGSREKREIFMSCYADKKWHIGGRGYLPGNEEINLRLERLGNQFSGYCSTDGKSWMLCGKLEFPAGDSVQVGLHAIGMIDRTIYCGEYREGTGTLFRNFRIWRKR
ncbi:tetratricopeptide repeat protein, partial [Candidatus Poribacteria bacterium]|nr:tetratricopeptide repeat protein [Candidatus Poribacteria bacterium]